MAKKKNSQLLPGLLEDIMSLLTPVRCWVI